MALFVGVAAMVGLSFASVPLYRLFCQVTGYGGTPKVNAEKPANVGDGYINVRFDANVSRKMPWSFKPAVHEVRVKLGDSNLAFYKAENKADSALTGMAVFNVTPYKAAAYFNKIDCFCFDEQTLKPGEMVDMPVDFYVDPAILKDPNARDVKTITLSYTFFPSDSGEQDSSETSGQDQAAFKDTLNKEKRIWGTEKAMTGPKDGFQSRSMAPQENTKMTLASLNHSPVGDD